MNSTRQKESQQASTAQAQAQAAQKRAQASFRPVPPRPTVDTNYTASSTDDNTHSSSASRKDSTPFAAYRAGSPSWQRQQGAYRPSSADQTSASGWASHKPSFDASDEPTSGAFGTKSAKSAKKASFAPVPPPRPSQSNNVPFAEANRRRTPYKNVSGEKTSLSGDSLRRTQSTRDDMRNRGSAGEPSAPSQRHHSVSPSKQTARGTSRDKPYVIYTSSEASASGSESESEGHDSPADDHYAPDDNATAQAETTHRPAAAESKHDSGVEDPKRTSMYVFLAVYNCDKD